jgi:AcrR family transcriptional regulator
VRLAGLRDCVYTCILMFTVAPQRLSEERVIEAGLALVRRQGFAALGLRAVAGELGVTPMALYRHVADGDRLVSVVVDRIALTLPRVSGRGRWRERLRTWATQMRGALLAYPGFAHHLLLHWFELPRALVQVEELLAVVEELDLRGFEGVGAANAIFTFVIMRVELEEALRGAKALRRRIAGLRRSPESLPRLRRNLAEYETAKVDEHFAYGLSLLLDGLARRRKR